MRSAAPAAQGGTSFCDVLDKSFPYVTCGSGRTMTVGWVTPPRVSRWHKTVPS